MTFVIWMTGLPCSGKTTLANGLKKKIDNLAVLDGDNLRSWLSAEDFSKQGRLKHNERVAKLAGLMADHKVPVCVALVSPYDEGRRKAREIVGSHRFLEVYVKCSLEECERRDVKGMYKLARQGKISRFTGVDDPFEEPTNPDLTIDTSNSRLEECIMTICNEVARRWTERVMSTP